MEFNVNASEAGARLRTGVGTHTLSIGDHDVTLMINGSRVELMTLALAIADQVGLKISCDGRIDGNEYIANLIADPKHVNNELRRAREEIEATHTDWQRQSIELRRAHDALKTNGDPLKSSLSSALEELGQKQLVIDQLRFERNELRERITRMTQDKASRAKAGS